MIDLGWSLRFKVVGIGPQPILSGTAERTVCCESFGSYLLNTSCICIMAAASRESTPVT